MNTEQGTAHGAPDISARTAVGLSLRGQIAILLVIGAIAGAGIYLIHNSSSAKLAAKLPASAIPEGEFRPTPEQLSSLKVQAVQPMFFRNERFAEGKIALNNDRITPVFSPYSGRVVRIFANLGDIVQDGAPLLVLEASEFVQVQSDLIAAQTALDTARSQLGQAQVNEKRKHALYVAEGGSLQDWQQSQSDLATTQNNVRAAESTLAFVRNRLHILGKNEKDINALEKARTINPVVAVVAPISGSVTDRQVGTGQFIQANAATPVFSIGDLSSVWLVANVREADAPFMKVGEPVEARVLAMPGRQFRTRLTYVAPSVDPANHRLTVRAILDNSDGTLKPEMFANISITTDTPYAAIAAPQQAIIYEGETARVWIVGPNGVITSRQITTGQVANNAVEVISGLRAGEKIVTSGALFLDRAVTSD